jgi:hypothetical protein
LYFLVWLIFMFLQDLQKKGATVGAVGAWPSRAVGAEASKAPMLDASETKEKESLPTSDVVSKERESMSTPKAGIEGKESMPKPTTEDRKDKVHSPSRVDAEV